MYLTCLRSPPHTLIPTRQDLEDTDVAVTLPDSPIDVDAIDDPLCPTSQQGNTKSKTCCGISVEFPSGRSAHSSYPYGIHDELGDPWDYSVRSGVMTLRAKGCTLNDQHMHGRCKACNKLTENGKLQGVLRRIKTGVHENTRLTYHSVGGLVTIVRRKIREVRTLRLHQQNVKWLYFP